MDGCSVKSDELKLILVLNSLSVFSNQFPFIHRKFHIRRSLQRLEKRCHSLQRLLGLDLLDEGPALAF